MLSGLSRIFRKPFANVHISRKVAFAHVWQIYACGPRSCKTFHGFLHGVHVLPYVTVLPLENVEFPARLCFFTGRLLQNLYFTFYFWWHKLHFRTLSGAVVLSRAPMSGTFTPPLLQRQSFRRESPLDPVGQGLNHQWLVGDYILLLKPILQ